MRCCADPPVCWLRTTWANTSSELNDSRQVHSLPLKHPRPPPRLVLTLFIAAGFWEKKEAENVSVFICFKSRPVLLQIHKKQHFFPSFFFFLSLAPLQHRPETRTDGDILCNPLRAYLDLSSSCILQQWRNNVFFSSCSLETGRNEKKKKPLLKGLTQSTFLLSNFFKELVFFPVWGIHSLPASASGTPPSRWPSS